MDEAVSEFSILVVIASLMVSVESNLLEIEVTYLKLVIVKRQLLHLNALYWIYSFYQLKFGSSVVNISSEHIKYVQRWKLFFKLINAKVF